MKYKYDKDIAALKYNLQQAVYELDRSFWNDEEHSRDYHFNEALKYIGEVAFKVQTFQQDEEYRLDLLDLQEEQANYNMKMNEAEDEFPY